MKKVGTLRAWSTLMLACAVVVGIGFGMANRASAAGIDPGFDLFMTPIGGGLLPFGDPNTTADDIPMMGNPFGGVLGSTDTIVERQSGLSDGATGVIEAELVALSLKSVNPISLGPPTDNGVSPSVVADSFFDVFVTLDPQSRSVGTLTITGHDDVAGGGTFDSFFDVFTKISLAPVGGGDPFIVGFSHDVITSTGDAWSHTCPAGQLACGLEGVWFDLPSGDPPFTAGNFFIGGPLTHTGPHPQTVPTPTPEPGTLLLLGSGLVGLAGAGWRRRRQ